MIRQSISSQQQITWLLLFYMCLECSLKKYTAWTVKFVLNLVQLTRFFKFWYCRPYFNFLSIKRSTTPNFNVEFGVVDHFTNKKRVDNTKFKTNLTVQAVCCLRVRMRQDFILSLFVFLFDLGFRHFQTP